MNLVVDIGNTSVKLAIFSDDKLMEQLSVQTHVLEKVEELCIKYNFRSCIISSVIDLDIELVDLIEKNIPVVKILGTDTLLPFSLVYKTPETLGKDRIALAAYAVKDYQKKDVLVIDAGTCITYDIVTAKNEYIGGAISPGLNMRFKALNNFTAKLPLVQSEDFNELTGKSTKESILSGVQQGVVCEVDGMISNYKANFNNLQVVITGGDHKFLHSQLKNSTFAHPFALTEGLNYILNYNAAI